MAGSPSADMAEVSDARVRRIRAVDRALDVLLLLSKSPSDLSLTTIARYAGMSKSATYELLRTLETRQVVERDPDTRHYRLSWTLYELGNSVLHRISLPAAAGYYLDLLVAQTGHMALLGILKEDSVLYIAGGEAPPGITAFANTGRRFPLHSTASGKVLLAFHHDSALMEQVLTSRLTRITDSTITVPAQLRRAVADVRSHGFATCWQEGEADLCSVAMPVRNHHGHTIAALALVGSANKLTRNTVRQLLGPLNNAVVAIEARLGRKPNGD